MYNVSVGGYARLPPVFAWMGGARGMELTIHAHVHGGGKDKKDLCTRISIEGSIFFQTIFRKSTINVTHYPNEIKKV